MSANSAVCADPLSHLGSAGPAVWPPTVTFATDAAPLTVKAVQPSALVDSVSSAATMAGARAVCGSSCKPRTEVEEERLRIAQELHDGALQLLGCVRLNVERLLSQGKLEQRVVRSELEVCLEWLDAGLIELRHSIVGLREGKGESLLPTLQRLLEDIRRFYKMDVQLTWRVHNSLPELVGSTVLRIAQEALHNAAKHAHADSVAVTVEADGQQVTLTVEDDGVGIGEQALRSSAGSGRYGLVNMREKAAAAGGVVAISGSKGHGTRVVLMLPLHN
ncbi:MAG: hypothetical protein EPO21_14335 [Chloroflexota bacterium]|nr:MAG: hypothetical protein EPO21_14335 [Chloroflexota bacterium]